MGTAVEIAEAIDDSQRKAERIAETKAHVVVTSNPGCIFQIGAAARASGDSFPILHIAQLLDASIRGARVP